MQTDALAPITTQNPRGAGRKPNSEPSQILYIRLPQSSMDRLLFYAKKRGLTVRQLLLLFLSKSNSPRSR